MGKDEFFPDLNPDDGGGEEVEILEVVGVDGEDQDPTPRRRMAPPDPEENASGEYVLDFDEDGSHAMLDPEPSAGVVAPPRSGDVADSDHQRLLRVRADYDNLRKRIEREREEFELHANFALVGRLLPVVDNMERALAADASSGMEGTLREGLAMIHRQLTEQLRQEGLQPIEAVGQPFDPNLHDAVATDPQSEVAANIVVEEFQKGYLFQDRVLRAALVKVSTAATHPQEEGA